MSAAILTYAFRDRMFRLRGNPADGWRLQVAGEGTGWVPDRLLGPDREEAERAFWRQVSLIVVMCPQALISARVDRERLVLAVVSGSEAHVAKHNPQGTCAVVRCTGREVAWPVFNRWLHDRAAATGTLT